MTDKQQAEAAKIFAQKWKGEHSEDQEAQSFWINLLEKVFGIEDASQGKKKHINFEKRVKLQGTTKKIDGYIPSTRVLIENKSSHISLDQAEPFPGQSKPIIAYRQAKEYDDHLPYHEKAEWIITCNFKEFWIYDMKEPENIRKPVKILLSNLGRDYKLLRMLVDNRSGRLVQEEEISVKAGELVKKIYNLLEKQYPKLDEKARRNLNILCVRIVFCLYAEDAGVFDRNQFHDYLERYDAADFGERLEILFEVLNKPEEDRSLSLSEHLKAFPYTNGGLFAEKIEVPPFTDELRALILDKASLGFNWCNISPTIFGALFESTINPETRSEGGMHYTSIENIHKVIDPLFLDDLKQELDICLRKKQHETDASQRQRLVDFQEKLASLRFLDPACGSGNFLTETYLSLREMENIVIRNIYKRQEGAHTTRLLLGNPIKVSIKQFYGIEYNDFAVSVAQVALWISEAKMLQKTEDIIGHEIAFLPLKTNANIVEGNALRMEWPTTDYIIGNPPFLGYSNQTDEQKADVRYIYSDAEGRPYPNAGKIDYVACWYMKSAKLMAKHQGIRAALVSTNSITQGEQVSAIWRPLMEEYGLHIDFAHRTFRWDNEADDMAHVHCVIVGFHCGGGPVSGRIFDGDKVINASHINAYLLDYSDVWIESISNALCNVPQMVYGNKPVDGGHLIIKRKDYDAFLKQEPHAAPYIKKLMGAKEQLNNKLRYCLWLKDCPPDILRSMPLVMQRISACRDMRKKSVDEGAQKLADTPHLFRETNNPASAIVVPCHSSESRRYIPLSFIDDSVVVTNAVLFIPNASLFHFGILESAVHMSWMRVVCGRLEMRYRYSKEIVYNNFPWPTPTDAQRKKIEQTAQAIINAREKYSSKNSLADMYGEDMYLYDDLVAAHKANDLAVMKAYDFSSKMSEEEIVKALFKMYQQLTGNE